VASLLHPSSSLFNGHPGLFLLLIPIGQFSRSCFGCLISYILLTWFYLFCLLSANFFSTESTLSSSKLSSLFVCCDKLYSAVTLRENKDKHKRYKDCQHNEIQEVTVEWTRISGCRDRWCMQNCRGLGKVVEMQPIGRPRRNSEDKLTIETRR
jgi:hypothetical protein